MRPLTVLAAIMILLTSACGGGSDDVTGTLSGNGTMTATIDGKAWSSVTPAAQYKNSTLSITGLDVSLSTSMSIGFIAAGPGTFSLALGNSATGLAIVARGSQSWTTAGPGGTGSVTLTTLTANHAVGTFSFDAIASSGSGVTHVTNGRFDITF